ncbi:hypothetical protein [Aurantiacibacter aquimixticola]|uniref:Uncharacterized protein n=1 Tax=Aurantiacibacter aquimixticola TaxID=1958945 RepID=A0A419RWB4_9SPHN|nr:hypothetical protein [Aurantiacibacter aquimixticola]RJY10076.1 hypothetical protein D6201_12570 [Aurantiacibacter aquimixticola]
MAALQAIDDQLGQKSIMVMVTHKPQLLTRFSRIIVMANGRIVKDGSARRAAGTGAAQDRRQARWQARGALRNDHLRRTDQKEEGVLMVRLKTSHRIILSIAVTLVGFIA